jgi:hypothetical protein
MIRPTERKTDFLPWLALFLIAALALPPLLLEPLPVDFIKRDSAALDWSGKWLVWVAMLASLVLWTRRIRHNEPRAADLVVLFAVLAAAMTAIHQHIVDVVHEGWQRTMYLDILNHTGDDFGSLRIPHAFRPLPYGFTRSLEWLTGDWTFACLVYRWFFTFWFVAGCYRFARLWLRPLWALATLLPVIALYPLSVWYYWGQLTDPLSHALFVLALIYAVQDRVSLLAVALGLGVLAKETVLLVVPAYFAAQWRKGLPAILNTALLGAVCVAAFLAARLPYGWYPGYQKINGTEQLMVRENLGLEKQYGISEDMRLANYWHPAVFVLPFVPYILFGWRRLDGRLQALCLVLPPLVLLSNLCFGWMYESRNYMPLLPLLGTAALAGVVSPNVRRHDGDVSAPTVADKRSQ